MNKRRIYFIVIFIHLVFIWILAFRIYDIINKIEEIEKSDLEVHEYLLNRVEAVKWDFI